MSGRSVLNLKNKRAKDETYTTDVVAVGAGGAGLAAAARSIQHGKDVIVLEKFPQIGETLVALVAQ